MGREREDFNGSAGKPSSKAQIAELEKTRIKPTPQQVLTPTGPMWVGVMDRYARQHNRTLTQKQQAMQRRMAKRKNQLKKEFTNKRDRRGQGLER